MTKKKPTITQFLIKQLGYADAAKCVMFLSTWRIVEVEYGRPITLDEYGDWWKVSRSQAWRRLALFRTAFAQFELRDPGQLFAAMPLPKVMGEVEYPPLAFEHQPLPFRIAS